MNAAATALFPAEYVRFIELFNAGDYFEAHEALETLWLVTRDERRDFYQGLIQAAAAFLKLQQHKPEPATRLAARALTRLERYAGSFEGLDRSSLTGTLHAIEAGRDSSAITAPVLELTGS